MAVQSFIQGQLTSIAQAQQTYRAASAIALPNPVRVWAQSSDGSVQGWAVCLSGGNGCLQIAVGNQGDPGTTLYLLNTTAPHRLLNELPPATDLLTDRRDAFPRSPGQIMQGPRAIITAVQHAISGISYTRWLMHIREEDRPLPEPLA